jgi:dipeptidase E
MKLFLASTFSDSALSFNQLVPRSIQTVSFIANAADPWYGKNTEWVEKDYNAFNELGFNINKLDLCKSNLNSIIASSQLIHICGGSAIYLLDLLKKSGYDKVIIKSIRDGTFYTSTSAGSMIMAPDISFCSDDEDEQEVNMVNTVSNLTGLELVPFYMMCHVQDPYYITSTKKSIDRLPDNKLPILFLRDGQAVYIEDDKFKIIQ